jgi:GNAT superfamily N-acetyltransferase
LIVTIREPSVDDVTFLREMLYLALFVPMGSPPLPRSVLDDPQIDRCVRGVRTRSADHGAIPDADGVPKAAAWRRYFTSGFPRYGFVNETTPELTIAVMKAYRSHGIGAQLVTHLQRHVPAISLSCDPMRDAVRIVDAVAAAGSCGRRSARRMVCPCV